MLQPMDTRSTPNPRPPTQRLSANAALLFDRASLEGLECQDSGWDEWDCCVIEQDLREEIAKLTH